MATDKDSLHIEQPPSVEDLVINRLRKAIVSAQLKPGESLDQEELANRFGVSRTPIRQALRALSIEKLITIHPRRGAFVSRLSFKEVEEIIQIRILIEGPAARLGAQKSTPNTARHLRFLHNEMLASSSNALGWLELDREFHMTIYGQSNKPRLVSIIESLRDDNERYIRTYIDILDNIPRSNAFHEKIHKAFEQGNPSECEQYLIEHLKDVLSICKESFELNGTV